ncbi:CDP-alcohol phosphatidyltransferase family protein [Saccharicrinis fermentans]|uniref:CDP-diacylglycerol-serine O-phosphatidyltransferase n=1 Tax=Saccharicrinis fermentans DSM 9555 = JCM 21142 TaxID=869213 RepID=W7XUL1_9BACT|nr:CDP-alcohol phosphatidyltransferase family protein [Saccharicrinis fermentans]GAF01710.1 CDP-diacylglycerol-serine O-phosphatidyltransferase [Saccharicrinis fermentans DSM 9555 = JCM 21142]
MSITKHVPNFITSLNLLCGTLSVFTAFHGMLMEASLLLFLASVFDFSDGFAARILKAYSPMGKELDSLGDMVSFGLAPMVMLHMMLFKVVLGSYEADLFAQNIPTQLLILSPFVVTVFSGLRLAKFNVDTRQSESFIGLTTTATGMFLASLAFVFDNGSGWLFDLLQSQWLLLAFVPVFSFLLISEIPMFSLKFKSFGLMGNVDKYTLLLASLFFLIWLGVGGIAITIALYVCFSLVRLVVGRA